MEDLFKILPTLSLPP